MKIEAIGLFVKNMATMVAFYRDIMGMQTEWNNEPNAELDAGGGVRFIMYGRDDFEQMTKQSFGYPNKKWNGTLEIAFDFETYADVDAEYERLVTAGVEPVFPPSTMPWGQRTCFMADPEGNLLEIGSFGK